MRTRIKTFATIRSLASLRMVGLICTAAAERGLNVKNAMQGIDVARLANKNAAPCGAASSHSK
ncbi:MAG: hypothetical protein ACO1OK_08575 [Devosia sp.]